MDALLEILKIVLPSGIVFATSYFLVKNFLNSEHEKRLSEARLANQQTITPIRLQAYERIILFLERISPNSLIARVYKNGMSSRQLQAELLKTIRAEFEHNLSQQIYMSNKTWEMVKGAKEENIKLINLASTKVLDNASGLDLSQTIIQMNSQLVKSPTQTAIENIKSEIEERF